MLKEDNSGFINFPISGKLFNRIEGGKTFIYLVSFADGDLINQRYTLSNLSLNLRGDFVSDDISMCSRSEFKMSLLNGLDRYFPNTSTRNGVESISSIPLTTCICIGWSDSTYEMRLEDMPWCATFRDLTNEGRKLYYTIKKLHNNKEVRILTFNNITD